MCPYVVCVSILVSSSLPSVLETNANIIAVMDTDPALFRLYSGPDGHLCPKAGVSIHTYTFAKDTYTQHTTPPQNNTRHAHDTQTTRTRQARDTHTTQVRTRRREKILSRAGSSRRLSSHLNVASSVSAGSTVSGGSLSPHTDT